MKEDGELRTRIRWEKKGIKDKKVEKEQCSSWQVSGVTKTHLSFKCSHLLHTLAHINFVPYFVTSIHNLKEEINYIFLNKGPMALP